MGRGVRGRGFKGGGPFLVHAPCSEMRIVITVTGYLTYVILHHKEAMIVCT